MPHLPETFLKSLEGIKGFERQAFIHAHEEKEQITSIRINPQKLAGGNWQSANSIDNLQLTIDNKVPWSSYGYYLPHRPSFTFDPLFHAGCYYVQEASSMSLEQALKQLTDLTNPVKVLDLSAAPGGKSTHIQSLISQDSLLVANEVIKSRCNILIDNIVKWGCSNVIVTNNDPKAFQKLPAYFDVIVVDAPCSGSGLFRRDEEAINEWSLNNVQLCSQRQQRILADVLPSLKENGILIYSTCSYSREEDEDIAEWLISEFGMENLKLQIENDWGIVSSASSKTGAVGYRFFQGKIKGEGFFLSCFRKTSSTRTFRSKPPKMEFISSREKKIIENWIKQEGLSFIKHNNEIIALPVDLVPELYVLKNSLNIQYAGVRIGEIMKERLVPHHALAVSTIISDSVPNTELSYEQAIRYLQKQEMDTKPGKEGWQTVAYQGFKLGWINALKNRINNYYPKELRILKQRNDSAFENL